MLLKKCILVPLALSLIPYINSQSVGANSALALSQAENNQQNSTQNNAEFASLMSWEPLGKKILGWLKATPGGKKLTDEIRAVLPVNSGKVLKAVVDNPLRGHSYQLITFTNMDSFRGERIAKLMKNKYTIFSTPDHSAFVYYDKKQKSWFLHKFDPAAMANFIITGDRVPVSKCLNAVHGHMGSVSALFRVTIHSETKGVAETSITFPRTAFILISLNGHLQVGTTLKVTAAVTCQVEKNQYAQPYVVPYYISIPEGERVKMDFDADTGIKIIGDWEETAPFVSLINKTPLVECAISESADVCGSDPRAGLHINDLKKMWVDLTGEDDGNEGE